MGATNVAAMRTAQSSDQTANPDIHELIGLAVSRSDPECEEKRSDDADTS